MCDMWRFLFWCAWMCSVGFAQSRTLRSTEIVEQENTGHRHEEIFLPLSVVEHGTVEGLLIDDMEPEKGPLVIEEIIDDTGMITNVIIERASDLSVENLEKSKRMNRKIGLVDEMPPPSEKVIKGDERRNRSWLLLVVLLVTVAFSMGFVLSVFFINHLPMSFGGTVVTRKQRLGLNKKLSMRPKPWREEEHHLYSPIKSPVRTPSHRTGKKTVLFPALHETEIERSV